MAAPAPPSTSVAPDTDASAQPTPEQRRGMRSAIQAQIFGAIASLAMRNGVVLLYFTALGVSPAHIVAYLAIPDIGTGLLIVAIAWFGERYGKRRIGLLGAVLHAIGFFILAGAGSLHGAWLHFCLLSGLLAIAVGLAMYLATWFALLSPLVPPPMRGGFFGKLRFAWQTVGILAALVCALYLSDNSDAWKLQAVIFVVGCITAMRLIFLIRIPELEPPTASSKRPSVHFIRLIRHSGYMSFAAYMFLLAIATTGCPAIMALVEKEVMKLSDGMVVFLGMLSMVGAAGGFLAGGRAIDRWSTRPVFLFAHFGYAVLLLLFIARDLMPWPALGTVGIIHLLYGLVAAASSVAVSTELLALIPPRNKGLSTSICQSMMTLGGALSAMLAAGMLNLEILAPTWNLGSATMSDYDAILLAYGVGVLLLVVTLGLVPSVLGKAQWMPR